MKSAEPSPRISELETSIAECDREIDRLFDRQRKILTEIRDIAGQISERSLMHGISHRETFRDCNGIKSRINEARRIADMIRGGI